MFGGLVLGVGGALAAIYAGTSIALTSSIGRSLVAALVPAVLVVPITMRGVTQPAMREHMPEIKGPWDARTTQRSFLAWAVYLFGYELFFRAAILGTLLRWLPEYEALAVQTALYTWAHMHKGWPETAGCILMGFVFGAMAIWSGGFLAPFLLHLAIGFIGEMTAAKSRA